MAIEPYGENKTMADTPAAINRAMAHSSRFQAEQQEVFW
jgi:hypothetical protein